MSLPPEQILREVDLRALQLMDALGAQILGVSLQQRGWTFHFDRARVRLGRCLFRYRGIVVRQLSLSHYHALEGWTPNVEDTVRHEIAHAIDYELRGTSGHDAVWKRLAIRCGASPKAKAGERPTDEHAPWRANCPSCSYNLPLYRRPTRRYLCTRCPDSVMQVLSRDGVRAFPRTLRAACPACGEIFYRARKPTHPVACKACCVRHNRGVYDARFRLVFSLLP